MLSPFSMCAYPLLLFVSFIMSTKGWEHKRALIISVVRETALFQFSIILSGDQNTVMISVTKENKTKPVIYIHLETVGNN